jgi:hypothetical protein
LSLTGPKQTKEAHERFWRWIFSRDDDSNHPLKISNNDEAQERMGNMLILAGSLQGDGKKDRSLRIPAGIESIFIVADDILCTEADGDGGSDQDLMKKADEDISKGEGKVEVSLNGKPQTVDLLKPHTFALDIQKVIAGTGNNRKGEGTLPNGNPPGQTRAAAACYYTNIPVDGLKPGDIIKISGRAIDVTYTVKEKAK